LALSGLLDRPYTACYSLYFEMRAVRLSL
jgi:hypothetical protein